VQRAPATAEPTAEPGAVHGQDGVRSGGLGRRGGGDLGGRAVRAGLDERCSSLVLVALGAAGGERPEPLGGGLRGDLLDRLGLQLDAERLGDADRVADRLGLRLGRLGLATGEADPERADERGGEVQGGTAAGGQEPTAPADCPLLGEAERVVVLGRLGVHDGCRLGDDLAGLVLGGLE
jgi:hypothetical protein